jgi:hypothetical protein
LCEAFLGVEPQFHLFHCFFFLRPIPSASKPTEVGGDELVLRLENKSEYLSYRPSSKGVEWKSYWFYVGNFESPLPERTPEAPKAKECWLSPSPGRDQVQKLRVAIAKFKKKGVTGGTVVCSYISRRVQPLQRRVNPGFRYEGQDDPSRFSPEKINASDLFKRCCKVLHEFEKVPIPPTLCLILRIHLKILGYVVDSVDRVLFLLFSVAIII